MRPVVGRGDGTMFPFPTVARNPSTMTVPVSLSIPQLKVPGPFAAHWKAKTRPTRPTSCALLRTGLFTPANKRKKHLFRWHLVIEADGVYCLYPYFVSANFAREE